MQRAEMEKPAKRNEANFGFDIDRLEAEATSGVPYQHSLDDDDDGSEDDVDAPISPHKEADIEPEEIHVDLNLTHQVGSHSLLILYTHTHNFDFAKRNAWLGVLCFSDK